MHGRGPDRLVMSCPNVERGRWHAARRHVGHVGRGWRLSIRGVREANVNLFRIALGGARKFGCVVGASCDVI